MNGVLVIDKPAGPTSHDVVARVRRAIGLSRIGHTGTLDPLATGVLPLVVGRATRLAQFLAAAEKAYDADIRLGITSDTYDAAGASTPAEPSAPGSSARSAQAADAQDGSAATHKRWPTAEEIERALDAFRGTFAQTPPAFSAKQVEGVRAYRLARRGVDVALKPALVTVSRLELRSHAGSRLRLYLECSAGFYVRSLAHAIGEHLGCGARLDALRRLKSGHFTLEQAIALEAIERDPAVARERLLPMHELLPELPAVRLTDEGARRARHGRQVSRQELAAEDAASPAAAASDRPRVRLLDPAGGLIAIADVKAGGSLLHPVIVLG